MGWWPWRIGDQLITGCCCRRFVKVPSNCFRLPQDIGFLPPFSSLVRVRVTYMSARPLSFWNTPPPFSFWNPPPTSFGILALSFGILPHAHLLQFRVDSIAMVVAIRPRDALVASRSFRHRHCGPPHHHRCSKSTYRFRGQDLTSHRQR